MYSTIREDIAPNFVDKKHGITDKMLHREFLYPFCYSNKSPIINLVELALDSRNNQDSLRCQFRHSRDDTIGVVKIWQRI